MNSNHAQKMWRELQAALNMIANALLEDLAGVLSPRLVISNEAETASTDGKLWVRLPEEFCGVQLGEQMQIFMGLLVHEIGHWLQPLNQVKEVEEITNLDHAVVNVLLDIHLEALVIRIFPLFAAPLAAVRELVDLKMRKDYEKGYKNAASFLEAANAALLFGRFCVDTEWSFGIPRSLITRKRTRNADVDEDKLKSFLKSASDIVLFHSARLPEILEQIAKDFPELCIKGSFMPFPNPLDGLSSGGDGLPAVKKALAGLAPGGRSDQAAVYEEKPIGYTPPTAETLALSRMLQKRWETPRAALSIMAPGRLNRLSAVRGDPVPFTIPMHHKGKGLPRTRIVLVLDWSGSMAGAPWQAALQSAQAIALAIRATGGDVRAALFADHLWHAPEYSAEALFCDFLGGLSMCKAGGDDTVFTWLPLLWQTFPDHQVLLLTDGFGMLPSVILPSGRKRTSAVLLKVHETFKGNSKAVAEIEWNTQVIAERYVHVENLGELAAAWAVLIPRSVTI